MKHFAFKKSEKLKKFQQRKKIMTNETTLTNQPKTGACQMANAAYTTKSDRNSELMRIRFMRCVHKLTPEQVNAVLKYAENLKVIYRLRLPAPAK